MKKVIKIVIFLAIVALLIVAAVKIIKKKKAEATNIPTAKIYPIVAKAMVAQPGNVTLTLPYLATAGNDADIMVASKFPARVEFVKKSGSRVKRGERVATLDTTDIQSNIGSIKSQISAANITLNNLIQTHKRTKELLAVQGASIEQYQKESSMIAAARAKRDALRQKLHELTNMLSYAQIIAPVDGVIAKTFVTAGSMAMPGKPLLQISARGGKSSYLLVRTPDSVPVKGVLFQKKVYDAVPLGSTFHGLHEYKVYVPAANLNSGDRVEVSVVIYKGNGVKLPFDAVLNRNGKSYVLQAKGDHALPEEINITQSGEEGIVTESQIAGQKLVIAKPDILLKLVSGYALKIKE